MATGVLNFAIAVPGALNFGREAVPSDTNELSIQAAFPAPLGAFQFYAGRRLQRDSAAPWQAAQPEGYASGVRVTSGQPLSGRYGVRWAAGQPSPSVVASPWTAGQPQSAIAASLWQAGRLVPVSVGLCHQSGIPLNISCQPNWQVGQVQSVSCQPNWQVAFPRRVSCQPNWQIGQVQRREVAADWQAALIIRRDDRLPWGQGQRPMHGWRVPDYVSPEDNRYRGGAAELRLLQTRRSGFRQPLFWLWLSARGYP